MSEYNGNLFSSPHRNRHERRKAHKVAGLHFEPTGLHARRYKDGGGGGVMNAQQNAAIQAAVIQLSQPMIQPTITVVPTAGNNGANGQVLNIPLNNVGLNTKITVIVKGTIAAAAAETLNKTQFGLANILSNVRLVDLSNYERINTTGWHLNMLATVRRQFAFGAAFVNDSPMNFASNFPINQQPTGVVAASGTRDFRMAFEIPLAYHDTDLRGAIYANVTSAQWRLQLTINANPVVATGADATLACWQSSDASVGNVVVSSVEVFQHYLDQLPGAGNGLPALPLMSLAWIYDIKNVTQTGMFANQDFAVPYANFRTFLSTIAVYDNAGVLNVGSDIAYWGIQVANQVFLERYNPFMAALKARNLIGDDMPRGTYLFDHRRKPIVTNQFGNTSLVLNASSVTAGAALFLGYEMLSIQAQAINAGALAAT